MRDYIVRFWKRMLSADKTKEDIDILLKSETITKEEYNAIISM